MHEFLLQVCNIGIVVSFQLMETGGVGVHGEVARWHAQVEPAQEQGHVTIQVLSMEVLHVVEVELIQNHAL